MTNVLQDKSGLMWIGTQDGLNIFNGQNIKKIFANTKDSFWLHDNRISNLTIDRTGNIWFVNDYEVTKITPSLLKFTYLPFSTHSILTDSGKNMFFGPNGVFEEKNGVVKKDDGWVFESFEFLGGHYDQYLRITKDKNNNIWGCNGNRLYQIDPVAKKAKKTIVLFKSELIHNIFFDSENNCWINTLQGKVYRYNTSTNALLKIEKPQETFNAFSINEWQFQKKKYILIGCDEENGLVLLDPISLKFQSFFSIKSKSAEVLRVNHIFIDKDNNLWLSTTNGVKIISNFSTSFELIPVKAPEVYYNPDKPSVYQLRKTESGFWLSERYNGGIYHYDSTWKLLDFYSTILPATKNKFANKTSTTEGYDFVELNKTIFITTEVGMVTINLNTKERSIIYTNDSTPPRLRNIVEINKENWMVRSLQNGIYFFDPIKRKFGRHIKMIDKDSRSLLSMNYLLKTKFGKIVATNMNGIYMFDSNANEFSVLPILPKQFKNCFGMATDLNGIIWIGTENGLVAVDIEKGKMVKSVSDELNLGLVYRVVVDDSNNVWFNCKKGYWCWQQNKQQLIKFLARDYLTNYEAEGGFFNTNDGDVYAGTKNAVIRFSNQSLSNYHASKEIIIRDVLINEAKHNDIFLSADSLKPSSLKPNQNNIDIIFSTTDIVQQKDFDFYYTLKKSPANKDWVKLQEGRISFNNLSNGLYKLKLKGKNKITGESTQICVLNFNIEPKWNETNAFKLAVVIAIAGFIYWFVRWRVRQIKKTQQIQFDLNNRLLKLEMQNLRGQMNPHFIFNSLNSINSYIVENKTHLASDYLTKFSRLIRLILENSKNEFSSIEKEIETLKLYLLMEQVRSNGRFEYSIHVGDDIPTESIQIPTMIIQPFVENAIWHGLMPKKEKGWVSIKIKQQNTFIHITIEDNGVGRQHANLQKTKTATNTKSYGMQITRQRITQLNPNNSVEVTDLFDSENKASGTLVSIKIYYYEGNNY